jgi:hypothetical protein
MKQGKLIRRAVSAALAGCMMFTLSAPALAESTDALMQLSTAAKSAVNVLDEENDMTAEPAYQMNLKNGSIEVYIENGKQYAKQGNNEAQQRGNLYITTDGGQTPNTLTIRGGDSTAAKVTLSNVNINASGAAVSVSGNVELVIEGTNTLHSGENHAGVEKADDNGTLTISGSGTLEASGGRGGAGIGSGSQKGCSNIVIESGTIIAHGGEWGAGIGSGNVGNRPGALGGSNITINDGDVTAYGGSEAAGIGGGFKGNGKDITINGGTVHAESGGGEKVAAIGGGRWDGKGENIQITGGDVTVKSGTGVWIGGTNGEISKSSLTGAVTYQDGSGSVVDEVVQDYGLEVGAENSTQTRVTSKNYKDILDKGVLSYDPTTQTLKSNGKLPRSLQKINAPDKDIELKGENSSTVTDKLIVKNAHNVTISSDKFAAIFTRDDTSTINCTGKVAIRSNEDMAVNGNLNIYDSSEVILSANSSAVTGSANITSNGDVTIESTDGRAAQELTINKAQNVTITISDAERAVSEDTKITSSGTVILKNNAQGGRVGTVDFTQADGKAYVYYISDEPDAKLIDLRIHPLAEAAESSYLRIEPRETTYSITVANGTAQVDDDATGLNTAFEGEKVTVKANAPTDEDAAKGVKFHHWKVEEGNISVDPTAGSLGSATEAGTEEISFDMPKGNVKLTAVYSIPASVLRNTVTVEGGKAKSTLGEGSGISAEIGTKVEISADTEEHPDKVFVKWEIVYPENFPENVPEELQLKLEEPNRAKTTFEMPAYPVKLIAHWSAIDPDESLDPGAGYDASSAAGGAIAAVAVGGAAIWGGYEITTRVILHNLLPEGAAIPANRGQLALLVWNTAGRPEPAGAPAFVDVTDPDTAKAAQWCTEQGIMDAKGDRFEPEGWTPKFKVIEVWNKAFPKQ